MSKNNKNKDFTVLYAQRNQVETLIRSLYTQVFFTFNYGILPDTPIEFLIERLDSLNEAMQGYNDLKKALKDLNEEEKEEKEKAYDFI